ncbi:MAG: glycyl-radical enzyme activating protein, partial [Kiritimatiellaceae bacterium]|nr:glycyl-radical enzyme activating protein [Kiritimatiellaceae bacterium]
MWSITSGSTSLSPLPPCSISSMCINQSTSKSVTPSRKQRMNGFISEIQRFSLHDGPGIRSTVFLKGCNMNCVWCHNPETILAKPHLQFFESKCIGCGNCAPGTATEAPTFTDSRGTVRVFRDNCHAKALVRIGTEMSVDDVLADVLQDINFYRTSGGGVTLSGGEVTIQPAFAAALLKRLQSEGIHTAIQTNLAAPWSVIESLLPYLDLVMFDIKHMNSATHKQWTGIGNETILENARRLNQTTVSQIARTPVIPGFNDTVHDIQQIAEFLSGFTSLALYELLNFNPLGADKYTSMGKTYPLQDARPLPF